jgi:hypothetical protein
MLPLWIPVRGVYPARMKIRTLQALAAACVVVAMAPAVFANGRFPRAQRLIETPAHPEQLVIAATYGLLVTENRGKNWSYVCDAAFTFQMQFASDVVIGLTANGSMLLGVQKSVTVSHDRGCDFAKVLEPSGMSSIDDFTINATNLNEVLALVTTFEGGKNTIRLQESSDGGESWKVIGVPVPAALAYTIDVDPQDSKHLYVTGTNLGPDPTEPALFITSTDRGASWSTGTIPQANLDSSPWIAAIHPSDGNKIFVRTDSWKKNSQSQEVAGDALLYSSDGGKNWTELLRPAGADPEAPGAKLLGFALSPDGSTVLAGYGDVVDPTRVVDPDGKWMGVYKSTADGKYSFGPDPSAPAPLRKEPVTCLAWTKEGIYACFAPPNQPHYLSFTTDPSFTPVSLETLMKANEVEGPPLCCHGRAVNSCNWSNDCKVLGACSDAGTASDSGAGTCGGAGGGGGAGGTSGGTSVDAGGAGGAAGANGTTGGTGGTAVDSSDGCSCRLVPRPARRAGDVVGMIAGTLIGATRRRRKRR